MIVANVEWVDAYTRDGWMEKEDALTHCRPKMICKTKGYLLEEGPDYVILAHTVNECDSGSTCMGMLHIPKGCIVKMTIK